MNNVSCDLVVPIYNEGNKIIKLIDEFDKNISIKFRVLLCYDDDSDDIFNHVSELKNYNFKIILVKNPNKGHAQL